MAFVDEVTIYAAAGKGGDGVIRWRRTKEKAKGGPSGGDGGRGGDVILVGVRDYAALANYKYEKKFKAEDGEAGKNELQTGADGEPVLLKVPVGTHVRVPSVGKEYEVKEEGERIIIFRGGKGGLGNARFKSSTNRNPFQQTAGKPGKEGNIELSLKLIADVGLIGLPNAGKSSLLNALTRAKSKIGDYPFTTLEPTLGDFYGYILADIPGLIEGASAGRGLGIKFLKHIERTGILLHLVSADQDDPLKAYEEVCKELEAFGQGLTRKREIIILSKIDLISAAERETRIQLLAASTGREVLSVTVEEPESVKAFSGTLSKILNSKHQTPSTKQISSTNLQK
ncbi:GTPase ObgE [Candidatus Kaiserbacteria bacterium]|nr:GTPase ObgE [Candidatus Kaiserbacteria bacterium]